jgi:hypothetical protein
MIGFSLIVLQSEIHWKVATGSLLPRAIFLSANGGTGQPFSALPLRIENAVVISNFYDN